MKKIHWIFSFSLMLCAFVTAQTPPHLFNYSAIARDNSNQPLASTTVAVQLSILKSSPTGAAQYVENHSVSTDAYGFFSLVIGSGLVQSGSFSTIEWSNDSYFLNVALDFSGGTNFVTIETNQLVSVPYALYAKKSGSTVKNGDYTHRIGEAFGGGVIFHLWKDNLGVEHGLIVDIANLSTTQVWSNIDSTLIGPSAQSSWNGLANSLAIAGQSGHTTSAAALCLNSTNAGQSDWYLPAIDELSLMWYNRYSINKTLFSTSGATPLEYEAVYYISSTEDNAKFSYGYSQDKVGFSGKNLTRHVRAVRAF